VCLSLVRRVTPAPMEARVWSPGRVSFMCLCVRECVHACVRLLVCVCVHEYMYVRARASSKPCSKASLAQTPWASSQRRSSTCLSLAYRLLITLLASRQWTGIYKEVAGNVSCSAVPSNTSSSGGNASCSPCPINASSPAGSAVCLCNPVSGLVKVGRERDDGREGEMMDKEKKASLACLAATFLSLSLSLSIFISIALSLFRVRPSVLESLIPSAPHVGEKRRLSVDEDCVCLSCAGVHGHGRRPVCGMRTWNVQGIQGFDHLHQLPSRQVHGGGSFGLHRLPRAHVFRCRQHRAVELYVQQMLLATLAPTESSARRAMPGASRTPTAQPPAFYVQPVSARVWGHITLGLPVCHCVGWCAVWLCMKEWRHAHQHWSHVTALKPHAPHKHAT
jgi:hypothetical protein